MVADALGIERVFIHPFAGVLPAFGLGLADVRALRESQFGKGFLALAEAEKVMADLVEKVRSEVASQAIPMDQITMKKMAHIRPEKAQQTLEVPFAAPQHMTAAFEAAHQQRFGFCPEDAVLLIDMLTAEAVGSTGETIKCLMCLEIKRPRNRLRCGLRGHIARCPWLSGV